MDDSEYLCPAEAEAYSRFSRNSGTYYVDGRRTCNWKRYLCILFLLPLLLLVCAAAIYGYILYANEPVKDDKVENQPVRDELENCNISNANIAAFTDFFNKYGRNQSSRTCEKLACFTANTASLPHYQGIELVGDYLGNTDFSDMCIDDRRKYLLGNLPAVETDVNFNEHAFPESYNCTGEVPQIVYNDTLGLANNIIAGLLQWTYHGNETLSNSTSLAEYIEKHNQDPLYRLNLVSELIENNQTRQAYLAINGPFATGGSINDGFFFIREHTFPDAICLKADVEQTDVVVIVVGYEDVDGSKSWYVQPVGEKWHNHAKNDTKTGDVVKISDDCFKKVFKFVIGFNNVEGRPSALTFF